MDKASFVRWGVRWALLLLALGDCGCSGKSAHDPVKSEAPGAAGAGGTGEVGAPAMVDAAGGEGGVSVSVAPLAACQQHGDCVVTHRGCCASCGEQSLANVVAISRENLADYRASACSSASSACSSCTSFFNPYLVARCVDGQCTATDLFQPPFTDCQVSEDCRVRSNSCCPCEQGASLISVSAAQESQLRAQLCDADATCDDCSSVSVTDVDAGCREGRCVLLFPF